MSRNLNFTLTDEERAALEQAITSLPLAEVRQRAIAIRLLHLGQSPYQVAEVVMVTSNTIYAWHKRWREQGLDGLRDGHRTGRPAKADEPYKQRLHELLEQDPRDLGLRSRSGRLTDCACICRKKREFCSATAASGRY